MHGPGLDPRGDHSPAQSFPSHKVSVEPAKRTCVDGSVFMDWLGYPLIHRLDHGVGNAAPGGSGRRILHRRHTLTAT